MTPLASGFVDDLVIDAVNRCRAVKDRALLLSLAEFASPNPAKLALLISGIASELARELIVLRGRYNDDPTNTLIQIRFLDSLLKDLGSHLRYVDGARTINLPWSLPEPLDSLLRRFVPGRTVMLRPQWKYNYTITTADLAEYYRQQLEPILSQAALDGLFTEFPQGFHIVSFPSIERKSALLHCDLGHELGHLVAEDYLRQESNAYVAVISERVRDHLVKENEARLPKLEPLFLQVEISDKIKMALEIRRRAIEELVSDMFACRVFGPAALLALHAVAVSFPLDMLPVRRSSYYPPWRMRIRRGLETVTKASLLPSQNSSGYSFSSMSQLQQKAAEVIDALKTMVAETSDSTAIDRNWLVALAYDTVPNALAQAADYVERVHGTSFLKPSALYGEVYELVDRLILHIPPNEVESEGKRRPASLEAMLNAAWFYRLAFMPVAFQGDTITEGFVRDFQTLNRLTLKAAEYAHLQGEYDTWAARKGQAP